MRPLHVLLAGLTVLVNFAAALGTSVPGTSLPLAGEDLPQYTDQSGRKVFSLSGEWLATAQPRPAPALQPNDVLVPVFAHPEPETSQTLALQVPGVWQNQGIGMNYHTGVLYRREFSHPHATGDKRVWLCFSRAATEARVRLNGNDVGSHTGAWTSFEFDVTELLAEKNVLEVHVDELPEHWTAGFLRNVSSAFGGLWGDVWLETRPSIFIADAFVRLSPCGDEVEAWVELGGAAANGTRVVEFSVEGEAGPRVARMTVDEPAGHGEPVKLRVPAAGLARWSPDSPALHRAKVRLVNSDGATVDEIEQRVGLRTFSATGETLRINDVPIYWAGILHWGIYPELLTPNRTREEFREEIRALKAQGFNAVNICLFVFPSRYYEVADEEGMMLWQEYPLWLYWPGSMRPKTDEQKDALVAEYVEMYRHVRRHPSVVLHSLAVEDPEADLALMERLYHVCHEVIPGSMVQDNSAFLNQKIADFIDHHPYDEHEGFRERTGAWMKSVRDRGRKLLLFGEAIDADTLRNTKRILAANEERPWWTIEEYCRSLMIPANANDFWGHERKLAELEKELGAGSVDWIEEKSREHAVAVRKYQIEETRLHQGFGGLAITAIRDTVCTRPGIYDDLGDLKWKGPELRRINAQTLPLLKHGKENRTYYGHEKVDFGMYISHFGRDALKDAVLECELWYKEQFVVESQRFESIAQEPGTVREAGVWTITLPRAEEPVALRLVVRLTQDSREIGENEWKVWVFPERDAAPLPAAQVHDPEGKLAHLRGIPLPEGVVLTMALDDRVLSHLKNGGRAVLIDPAGAAFPSHDSPFWREVAVERYDKVLFDRYPWTGAIDLPWLCNGTWKTYDISPKHEPLLRTINCRYLNQNDLIIATEEHGGRLVATTLNLHLDNHPAATWMIERMAEWAAAE